MAVRHAGVEGGTRGACKVGAVADDVGGVCAGGAAVEGVVVCRDEGGSCEEEVGDGELHFDGSFLFW